MASPKLLIGGVFATGSVATAGVVANQYGLFNISSSTEGNQNTETGTEGTAGETTVDGASGAPASDPAQAPESTTPETKTKQQEIQNWIDENVGTGIEVKTKINGSSTETLLKDEQENNLDGLKDYLSSGTIKEELKSLILGEHKTLVFAKNESTWTYSITHANITAWVKENWGNSTTLKIQDGETTELSSLQDEELRKLFEHLFSVKTSFAGLKSASEAKTLLFVKEGSDWKHIKTSLEKWVTDKSGNISSLKVKDNTSDKNLSDINDEDLKTLLEVIKKYEKMFTVWKDESDKKPLVFEKSESTWKHKPDKDSITKWVKGISNSHATLNLWEGDQKKELDNLSSDYEAIFKCLEQEENKNLLSNLGAAKTVIFEKIDNSNWKHIKKAIEDLITNKSWEKSKIKIKSKNDATPVDFDSVTDDNLLTGLFKHLNDNKDNTYSELTKSSEVTFEKTNSNWSKVS